MIQKLLLRPGLAFAVAATSVKGKPLIIAILKKRRENFRKYATVVDVCIGL